MSADKPYKKRRLVKKLDFENCVVSGVKFKTKGKKRLRARITRNENCERTPECENPLSHNRSPILLQKIRLCKNVREFSPVSSRSFQSKGESPVFRCSEGKTVRSPVLRAKAKCPSFRSKRRIRFDGDDDDDDDDDDDIDGESAKGISVPTSPVFNLKNSRAFAEQNDRVSLEVSSTDTLEMKRTIASPETQEMSYLIEEFTQESVKSGRLLSRGTDDESKTGTLDNSQGSADEISECSSFELEASGAANLVHNCTAEVQSNRKNSKKDSLLSRLKTIKKKQSSERLLWQHQRENGIASNLVERILLTDIWTTGTNYVLKCETVTRNTEVRYLLVDRLWVPDVVNAKVGSILHLYPPWQKIEIDPLKIVILSVLCLEIVDEVLALETPKAKRKSAKPSNAEENILCKSLLSLHVSPFLA